MYYRMSLVTQNTCSAIVAALEFGNQEWDHCFEGGLIQPSINWTEMAENHVCEPEYRLSNVSSK